MTIPKMPEVNIDNIRQYFQDMKDYRKRLVDIARENSTKGCVSARTKNGKYKAISKDILSGDWRITYFDENGWPTSHDTSKEWEDLAYELMSGVSEFSDVPAPPASMDDKETIIQRVRQGVNEEFDILELITFHRLFPHQYIL